MSTSEGVATVDSTQQLLYTILTSLCKRQEHAVRTHRSVFKLQDVVALLEHLADQLSSAFRAEIEEGTVGWDVSRLGQGMLALNDGFTVVKENDKAFAGAVGPTLYCSGHHSFAVHVEKPVDDAFWVGVAYANAYVDENPKKNCKSIVWSGGNRETNRPGTLRVHGEKMRNQSQYSDGDIIGVSVDLDTRTLAFYLNGERTVEWSGVLKGPVNPYISFRHANGPAATLFQLPACASSRASNVDVHLKQREVVTADFILVDGSLLEGGGQVLRVALACAALFRNPVHIHSIRAGRRKPGLGHQHSTGARLIADLCGGIIRPEAIQYGGHCEGVGELFLWPGSKSLRGGQFVSDTHTAGAVTLLLQAALPCALLLPRDSPLCMVLKGGTNVRWSPPIDFVQLCLFPALRKFDIQKNLSLQLVRRGYYPKGGGEIIVEVEPVRTLKPISMVKQGTPVNIVGAIFGFGLLRRELKEIYQIAKQRLLEQFGEKIHLDLRVSEKQPAAAERKNRNTSKAAFQSEFKKGLSRKERKLMADERRDRSSVCAGCVLVLETDTGSLISGDSLIECTGKAGRIFSAKEVADEAVNRLTEAWEAGGCVDEYLMDQLIIFMALANGTSQILCPRTTSISSRHLDTAIYFAELLCGVKFRISKLDNGTKLIECDGIAYGVKQPQTSH